MAKHSVRIIDRRGSKLFAADGERVVAVVTETRKVGGFTYRLVNDSKLHRASSLGAALAAIADRI